MKTKTLLNKIKKASGLSWHELAKRLNITYSYICYLRRENKEPGRFLKWAIERGWEIYKPKDKEIIK
jgi:transcriptional regulator with XRE-family HTH domain